MNQIVFLFLILVLAIGLPLFLKLNNSIEGYTNYSLAGAMGNYPNAQTDVLVQDTYPAIGKNELSNETSADMWWHYPTFKLGSYHQITNNIRYSNNPDIGNCMPASMCGALYHEKKTGSNYIEQLPPVDPNSGTRIGYFTTDENLLPFRTDTSNILY
jgi:hypothetical protein